MIGSFGPAAPNFSALQTAAENRELTDGEVADLLEERIAGVAARKARIKMAHEADRMQIDDIVPDCLRYYEQFCGPDHIHFFQKST